jgi:hypothetical protein
MIIENFPPFNLFEGSIPQRRELFAFRNEAQSHTVVAPPLAGGGRTVVEDVTLMAAATDTVIFRSWNYELEVGLLA